MSDLDDFWDDAPDLTGPELGPIFTATYESDSSCCGDLIVPGEDIRADGCGGWIHASDECERAVR